ncbi:MAG: DNA topoisomerase IB [Fluviicola sp.]
MRATEFIQAEEKHFDIVRIGEPKSFSYAFKEGDIIHSSSTLRELKQLVIPPNWVQVEICSDPRTHIRAFGFDEKGRKQYIYNEAWREEKERKKFNEMISFARALPKIRKKAFQDLHRKQWDKQKALALVVLTLDNTHIRIGSERYKKRNKTYGATTLRRKHIEVENGEVVFKYKGKSNKYRSVRLDNRMLSKLVLKSAEMPGYEIFKYKEGGAFHSLNGNDVNAYLQEITNESFTAKDFRTWAGTSLCVEVYKEALEELEKHPRRKFSTAVVRKVAKELGNTVSVCRSHYIHPTILKILEDEDYTELEHKNQGKEKYGLSAAEKKALELITPGKG